MLFINCIMRKPAFFQKRIALFYPFGKVFAAVRVRPDGHIPATQFFKAPQNIFAGQGLADFLPQPRGIDLQCLLIRVRRIASICAL